MPLDPTTETFKPRTKRSAGVAECICVQQVAENEQEDDWIEERTTINLSIWTIHINGSCNRHVYLSEIIHGEGCYEIDTYIS
jgi:hypothetical protein